MINCSQIELLIKIRRDQIIVYWEILYCLKLENRKMVNRKYEMILFANRDYCFFQFFFSLT